VWSIAGHDPPQNHPAGAPTMSTTNDRSLGIENLEARRVMAGNVFVMHFNNALQIYGDTKDNAIVLTEQSPGVVRVAGLNNTTINGRLGEFTFRNPSDNLNISMGQGNDYVIIGTDSGPHSRFGTINVKMGSGADVVGIKNTSTWGLEWNSFNLGDECENDRDAIQMERCNMRQVAINGGGGDDWLYAADSTINNLLVSAGSGHDLLWLVNTTTDRLFASLGAGNDTFKSWNSRPRIERGVDGGDGIDTLKLGGEGGVFGSYQYLIAGQAFENRQSW
jgi:hypothetical protein